MISNMNLLCFEVEKAMRADKVGAFCSKVPMTISIALVSSGYHDNERD